MELLNDEPAVNRSVSAMSAEIGCSPAHLMHAFRAETGTTLRRYRLQLQAATTPAPADPVAAARAAATRLDRAQLDGDRATIDRYLASDFVFVRGAGAVSDRNAFLAAFTDPDQKLEPFTIVHPIAIRLADNAVIIGGETTLRGTDHGAPFAEHLRYADIFQLRDGRWQVVYTQVTMMK